MAEGQTHRLLSNHAGQGRVLLQGVIWQIYGRSTSLGTVRLLAACVILEYVPRRSKQRMVHEMMGSTLV